MPNFLDTFVQTSNRIVNGFQSAFANPAVAINNSQQNRLYDLEIAWQFYNGSLFDRNVGIYQSQRYKMDSRTYRNVRYVHTVPKRLVEFYVSVLYPGNLNFVDAIANKDSAIPLSQETSPELLKAVEQLCEWSNWQSKKSVLVRYCAALGSCLVEIHEDTDRENVSFKVIWTPYVRHIVLDDAGNVKSYILEYKTLDTEKNNTYIYKKVVDNQTTKEYKDGTLISTINHNYGFCPAVWFKHLDFGQDWGYPAFTGSYNTLIELLGLTSHAIDQVHKVIAAPVVFWAKGNISKVLTPAKRAATDDYSNPSNSLESDRESILLLQGAENGRVDSLAGQLSLSDTKAYIDLLIQEIEKTFPELSFYDKLREMSQVTGTAVARIIGDIRARVDETASNYDTQMVKLLQMGIAIAGEAQNNYWMKNTKAQKTFNSFSLASYDDEGLDIDILPRTLIHPTSLEKAQSQLVYWQAAKAANDAGYPVDMFLEDNLHPNDRIDEFTERKIDEDRMEAEQQQKQIDSLNVDGLNSANQASVAVPGGIQSAAVSNNTNVNSLQNQNMGNQAQIKLQK